MREPMWPRAGLMRRLLLLATSLILFVSSDIVPTSPRGCSSCCSGCGGSLSDATSICQEHAFLRRRDRKELATEVMGTPCCARGTSASLAFLRPMPLQLRGGDGGSGGRDRDMRDREASRGYHPGDFNSPGTAMAPGQVVDARWIGDGQWHPATLGVQRRPGLWQVKFVGYEDDGWQDTARKDIHVERYTMRRSMQPRGQGKRKFQITAQSRRPNKHNIELNQRILSMKNMHELCALIGASSAEFNHVNMATAFRKVLQCCVGESLQNL